MAAAVNEESSPMEVDETDTGGGGGPVGGDADDLSNISDAALAVDEGTDKDKTAVSSLSNQGEDSSSVSKGFHELEPLQVLNLDAADVNDDNARDGNDFGSRNDEDEQVGEITVEGGPDDDDDDNSTSIVNISNIQEEDESGDNSTAAAEDPFGFEANAVAEDDEEESSSNKEMDKVQEDNTEKNQGEESSSSILQSGVEDSSCKSTTVRISDGNVPEEGDDDDVLEIHEAGNEEANSAATQDTEQEQPPISIRVDGIFESNNDEEEEIEASVDPDDIKNMLQVDFSSDHEGEEVDGSEKEATNNGNNYEIDSPEVPEGRSRPRRAAAAAAASTIREITVVEEDVQDEYINNRRRRRADDDTPFDINNPDAPVSHSPNRQKCVVCKKLTVCQIKIQQFGTDVYICSNACFNNMRYPASSDKKRLPCCQCGISSREYETVYFWETMNFCSDLCVGLHQLAIGANCATCSKKCPWLSIGKYCVRFGSDIRQFCTASCLESYKKNARVCFHCQLDIKRLGNVILANIPTKNTPKEFCSQDCVEMYVEQNLHQTVRNKKTPVLCGWCKSTRESFREIVLHDEGNFHACSQTCFNLLLELKHLKKCKKCETCVKYINMDYTSELPPHFVSTQQTLFGFCSATCKNVFVLKNREILSCVTCKVKKYNYDLVQVFTDKTSEYAVCSLNCLPKSQDYINQLKMSLFANNTLANSTNTAIQPAQRAQPQTLATTTTTNSSQYYASRNNTNVPSGPVINSVVSIPQNENGNQETYMMNTNGSDGVDISENADGTYSLVQTMLPEGVPPLPSSSAHFQIDLSSTDTVNATNGFDLDPKFAEEAGEEEFAQWDGVLRAENIQEILEMIPPYVEMKDVYTMVKPRTKEIETQTDESELSSMERVPLKELEKIRYVPMPIPYAVYIPAPFYLCETPVPFPVPLPVPVPVPIPVIFDGNGVIRDSDRLSCLFKNVDISPKPNGVAAMDTSHNTSDSDIVEIDCESESGTNNAKGNSSEVERSVTVNSGNVELMDCTSPVDRGVPISPDIIPDPITLSTNNTSSAINSVGVPMNSSPGLNSPVRSSGANSPFLSSIMNSTQGTGSPASDIVSSPSSGRRKLSRVEYGLRAWKTSFGPTSDPLNYSSSELASKLAGWVKKGTKPNGERYRADIILYLCLGVQQHLHENNRQDNIFFDAVYQPFLEEMTNYAETECAQGINTRVEDSHFWESGQLGASTPGVLLFTLVYFLYKNFNLKTWEKMANLHFTDIRVEPRDTDVINAFHPKVMTIDNLTECEGMEVVEDPEKTTQCPIKFYEIYKSKCSSTEGPFFKAINESFTPTGNDWFSTESLNQMQLYRMLVRAMMIKTSPEAR